jgi:hypothetical protein
MPARDLILAVASGRSPAEVLQEALSPGLQRAHSRIPETAWECPKCKLRVPVYPGAYPGKCPECGANWVNELKTHLKRR